MTQPTRRERIVAMALQTESPEEAAVAREKLRGDITILPRAQQALAEAVTLTDMKDIHDFAVTLRAGARARGMGIEAENMAADLIIRAERKMGAELIRMAEAGERQMGGRYRDTAKGENVSEKVLLSQGKTNLGVLGISYGESWKWQKLAAIPEDQFEVLLDQERNATGPNGQPQRLSRIDIIRTWFGVEKKVPTVSVTPTAEDGGFLMFRQGAYALLGWKVGEDGIGGPTSNELQTLPDDELQQVAALIKYLADAYNVAKADRA